MIVLLPLIAAGLLVGVGGYTFWYGRGYSYLLDDPVVCTNCHIMRDNFDSWNVSSHRRVICNECHLPHDPIAKYLAKSENGFRHSWAFTFEDVQVLRITQRNLRILEENCVRCHETMVFAILGEGDAQTISCARCHAGAGHVF